MKIGLYRPSPLPFSIENYIENICGELINLGLAFSPFAGTTPLPDDVDLFWDPRAAGGVPPHAGLLATPGPVIVTVHGAAPIAMSAREYFPDWRSALRGKIRNRRHLRDWRAFRGRYPVIVTVSQFAESEIKHCLELDGAHIVPIHHGVDAMMFNGQSKGSDDTEPYFLHASQYQPIKNLGRIIEAHSRLPEACRPNLFIVAPGAPEIADHTGVEIVRTPMTQIQLASLYRDATAFVFPSLRESFGMPILEAMASGCPVITSNDSACAEVAGDAAFLVDPRSVGEIADAMCRLASDSALRSELRERGLARAAEFTWRRSAEQHLAVFERAIREQRTQ